jgi:AbrB family looped-hinge helix DNA binding protein
MESALSVKGQATIPKAIREHLHLGPGDRVKFFVHPDGSVVILPKVRVSALKGMVRAPKRRVSLEEMEAGIAAGTTGGVRRRR